MEPILGELEGMFAFALYDRQERSLLLARDRFGIKPLYLHRGSDRFLFASTVGALRPWLDLAPDPATVSSYLRGCNGPTLGRSFYQGIEFVPPGAVIRVRSDGGVEQSSFCQLSRLTDPAMADELAHAPAARLLDQVESLLARSVEHQLVADAPVGAFCSGGVDSSLIMAMAARINRNLKVFHADVVGPESERQAADTLARHLKLDLHAVAVRDQDFLGVLPEVVQHFEFPVFVHPTAIPVLLVSRLAREQGVKAVLSGEGSDEAFLGYPWLSPNIPAALRRRLPAWVSQITSRRFGSEAGGQLSSMVLSPRDRDLVLGLPHQGDLVAAEPSCGEGDELFYILRTLLHRNDSMGMAASIECRFPFLDSRLIKLAVNLPHRYKVRFAPSALDPAHPFFRDKWIIRTIAKRYLPAELSRRIKQMFPTTAYQRLVVGSGFFAESFVRDWLELPRTQLESLWSQASHALRLRLFFLEAWAQVCVQGSSGQALATRLNQHVRVVPLA